jgi:cytochrome b involved in lipid metabolism
LIDQHPGGANAILALAGKDATEDFDLFHSPSTIKSRPEQGKYLLTSLLTT